MFSTALNLLMYSLAGNGNFARKNYISPELSRNMAYTTRNTANRLARKEFNLNPVVLELSKEKETYTSSSRHELDQLMQEKHENFSGQMYSFLEVKLRHVSRKT